MSIPFKVKSQFKKTLTTAFIIFMATALVAGSSLLVQAQTTTNAPTYPYVVANPNPLGVNQTALVDFWMSDITPNSVGATGDFYSGVTIVITDPTGTNTTMGPYTLNSSFHRLLPICTKNNRQLHIPNVLRRQQLHRHKHQLLTQPKQTLHPNSARPTRLLNPTNSATH